MSEWRDLSSAASSKSPSRPGGAGSRREGKASKREQVAAACFECRSKKVKVRHAGVNDCAIAHSAKCDAQRPTCARCQARSLLCFYDVEPDTTRAVALKRKHESVQEDLDRMMELYGYLRTRTDAEVREPIAAQTDGRIARGYCPARSDMVFFSTALTRSICVLQVTEIIRHIRQTADPFSVLRLVQEGDLLLQRTLNNASSEVRSIDADALQQSKYKLRARPWTNVTGDGIVSNLITIVLTSFSAPYVHESAFLADLASQDPNATFCSPLLVNAMCAVGAYSSTHAEALDSLAIDDQRLRVRFYHEAQRLLEIEQGKPSLTTMQALFLLYQYTAIAAIDRAGRIFRLSACEMYNHMRLGTQLLVRTLVTDETAHRRILSRIAWGSFCAESVMAYNYLQASLIKIPTIPRLFGDQIGYVNGEGGRPFGIEDVLAARCDILAIFYRIASYQPREPNGISSDGDMRTRQRLYDALRGWERTLPPKSRYATEFAHHFHALNAHYHFAAVVLWRPLQDTDIIPRDHESDAASLCIRHCDGLLKELDNGKVSMQGDSPPRVTAVALYFWYMAAFTLVTMIKRHLDSRELLVYVCRSLHRIAKYVPAACVILQGVQSMSQQLRVILPHEATELCMEASKFLDLSGRLDIPVSWAIPPHADLLELLSDHGADAEEPTGVELSKLISKWSTLSIEPDI